MLLLQRQGRIGFFMESNGAGGLPDRERIPSHRGATGSIAGYRNPGTCLVRGVPLKGLFDQMMANAADPQQGQADARPLGLQDWKIVCLSSPVA